MRNLILIGMMGCGKTTVGGLLAGRLGLELADTDALIEQREKRSIPEIFVENGESYFREIELLVSEELGGRQGLVIACGGGLPLREGAIFALKRSGPVFWLRRDPGETYDTMEVSGRPLAQQGRSAFLERFARREPVYRRWADYIIEQPTPEDAARAVEALYLDIPW